MPEDSSNGALGSVSVHLSALGAVAGLSLSTLLKKNSLLDQA
jgi:hypothetical protein